MMTLMTHMDLDFLKTYILFMIVNIVFIIFVLRAVFMLINRRDPINAVTIHPSEWKMLKWDKDKVDKKVRSVMS